MQRLITDLKQHAIENNHRGCLILEGDPTWLSEQLAWLSSELENSLIFSESDFATTSALSFKQAKHQLGKDNDSVVFDLSQSVDANALGAISGTIKAGALLVLLVDSHNSSNVKRWLDLTLLETQVCHLKQGQPIPALKQSAMIQSIDNNFSAPFAKNQQQQDAVQAIDKVLTGHRNRPLILTADRGRGKTTALGIACINFLNQGKRIVITAPQFSSVENAFRFIEQNTSWKRQGQTIESESGKLSFLPPDVVREQQPELNLLLVDEAAAIPVAMLTSFTDNYSRTVFSSTIHGYEGSGRGFEIRFKKHLVKTNKQPQYLHLTQPIRWAENDPLELFINHLLILNADLPEPASSRVLNFQRISTGQLLEDPALFKHIVALLQLAHYKTSANDVMQLLWDKSAELFIARQENIPVAVTLIHIESINDQQLADDIFQGKRRIKGHLVPQTLLYQMGDKSVVSNRYARIVRIAVHPKLHQQSIGSQLLAFAESELANSTDFFASSFGATAGLVSFWQKQHYFPVRLGFKKEATSNEYSVMVIKDAAEKYRQQFFEQLLHQLPGHYQNLDELLVAELLREFIDSGLSEYHKQQANRAIEEQLDVEQQQLSCSALMLSNTRKVASLPTETQQLLIGYLLQQKPLQQLSRQLNISGRQAFQKALRQALRQFI